MSLSAIPIVCCVGAAAAVLTPIPQTDSPVLAADCAPVPAVSEEAEPTDGAAALADLRQQVESLDEEYPDAPFWYHWDKDSVTVYQKENYDSENADHRAYRKRVFETITAAHVKWGFIPPAVSVQSP